MQRLGSPSVFPALPGASTQLWKCQTRYRHPRRWWRPRKWGPRRRDAWPTFEISDLLLDLDAEGVKGVRAFDSQLDGVPESASALEKRKLRPIKARVAEFEKGYEECQSSFQTVSADKFHPLHISDFDLLAATLFDSPDTRKMTDGSLCDVNDTATHAGMLGSVLDGNGIPRTIRNNTSKTTTYMLHRRRVHGESRILSPDSDDQVLLSLAFSRYATFREIDRLITRIIHTPEGCRTLSTLSDELYLSFKRLVPEVDPLQLLSLLNNLLINFDRHGLHMSSKLLSLGLWTSLKCQAISTAHQYLERKCKCEYLDKRTIHYILNTLLQTSITSNRSSPHEFQSNSTTRLTTLFSLLTGYVPGENQPTVSLQSLISHKRVKSLCLYIECLARLGAFRTLWHQWHAIESASQAMDGIRELNSGFVSAILEALDKNRNVRTLARSLEFANATGQFREDCQLDMLAISKSADILALPENNKENHDPTPDRIRQQEELYQIFREKQIQKAMPALQAFLI
ncbi:hypothetical protein FHL15_008296 [Xylaria flabelliformis]|uniref:Uncharacterized protein n=1 Tax=Xylaria flabelliformis TaxID=2512241 RepID=A0A553HRY2_9PEZI|nr:hypothetical protein FHL15_008296 [Xylaria flabelliformis]